MLGLVLMRSCWSLLENCSCLMMVEVMLGSQKSDRFTSLSLGGWGWGRE